MLFHCIVLSTLVALACSQSCQLNWQEYAKYFIGTGALAPECRPYLNETDPSKLLDPAASPPNVLCCATFVVAQLSRIGINNSAPGLISAQLYPQLCSLIPLYEACVRGKSTCSSTWNDWFLAIPYFSTSYLPSFRAVLCDESDGTMVHPRLEMLSQNPEAQLDCITSLGLSRMYEFCFGNSGVQFLFAENRTMPWTEEEQQLAYDLFKDAPGCTYQFFSRNTQCSEPALKNAIVSVQWNMYYALVDFYPRFFNITGLQNIPPLYDPSNELPIGNPALLERCTAGVTGDPHHFFQCGTGEFLLETCSSQGQQNYLVNTFIVITARNEYIGQATRATTVQELSIQFFPRFDLSTLTYNASSGTVPSTFSNGQSSYITGNDTIQIRRVSAQHAIITHSAAGLWLEVQARANNYFFTVRLSKEVWDLSLGILKGCGPNERLYLSAESARRRRQTVGALCSSIANEQLRRACEFDCTAMNQMQGCQDMTSASETSLAVAVSNDAELIEAAKKANEKLGSLPTTTSGAALTTTTTKTTSGGGIMTSLTGSMLALLACLLI